MLSELRYALHLNLAAEPESPLSGSVSIRFLLAEPAWPEIDFEPLADTLGHADAIAGITVAGGAADFELGNGRIRILAPDPAAGEQQIDIEFTTRATGLMRRPGLVYSLFVPARAHTVFPCFDQPDLKARLRLTLEMPSGWEALANAAEADTTSAGARRSVRFAETVALPSYLFAFVAGDLQRASHTLGPREFQMLSAKTAAPMPAGKLDEILALHAAALDYLEQYTRVPYPFSQIGIAIIPDFDFGGMEHPGITLYRQNLLMLTAGSGIATRLRRAGLIAHEMAHMWFGNLVTMRWFDDVWLKEVFASFMADKIVAAAFPDVDHGLEFALKHLPPAFAIDRTEGAHAIRQPLDNLAEAGELYDAIIYHKAPIAMAQLEADIGTEAMRRGLQTYLSDFAYANANWHELRDRLQRETPCRLDEFSRRWIETPGRPSIEGPIDFDRPPQYGARSLDEAERLRALEQLTGAAHAVARATAWISLYEDMLDGGVLPARLLTAAVNAVADETEELLLARILEDLHEIYWRFLQPGQRALAAGPVERVLRLRRSSAFAADAPEASRSLFWLGAYARFACSQASLAEIEAIWRQHLAEPGRLPEALASQLAMTLALARAERGDAIMREQIATTRDIDLRQRLSFLRPAFAADPSRRDAFFAELTAGAGRGLWAVAGAALLNHPLRATEAESCIGPGLRFAAGLRQRGDIFLPRQWLTALFSGHGTDSAAATVRSFLDAEEHPPRFRQLVLQTADPVLRAARIRC